MKEQLCDIPKVQIDKPIRLIELFGGIGSQAMARLYIVAPSQGRELKLADEY